MTNSATLQDATLQTFRIDPSHSQVNFSVRHMGFSKVRGRFEVFEGTVRMAPGQIDTLEAKATVDVASLTTGDEKRDAHLRSEDFFEADTHPELTFKSTGVKNASGSTFSLAGELTIRGTTKAIELDAEFLGEAKDPWGGTRVAFEAEATINRKNFGLNWNQALEAGGVLVGETVEITLEAQAVRAEE